MQKVCSIVLAMVVVILMITYSVTPTLADELGIGPVLVDGHTEDGSYAMNNDGKQSWGVTMHFNKDMDWAKQLGKDYRIGLEPGAVYLYSHWTKNNGDCKHYTSSESVNSHIFGTPLTGYIELHKRLRLLAFVAPAIELVVDGKNETNPAVIGGGGIQYRFTENLATSLRQYEVFSDLQSSYKRFDATVLSVDLLF